MGETVIIHHDDKRIIRSAAGRIVNVRDVPAGTVLVIDAFETRPSVAYTVNPLARPVRVTHPEHVTDPRQEALRGVRTAQWDALLARHVAVPEEAEDVPKVPPLLGAHTSLLCAVVVRKLLLLKRFRASRRCAILFTCCLDIALGVLLLRLFIELRLSPVPLLVRMQNEGVLYIKWLLGWPAGFKGNAELNKFLGTSAMFVMNRCDALRYTRAVQVSRWFPLHASDVGWGWWVAGGLLGASGLAALLMDVVMLLTANVHLSAKLFGVAYNAVRSVVVDMSLLLRGRKFNTLRNKVDSHTFDVHQKLVGALAFTLSVFLLPTVVVYFLFFVLWALCLQTARDVVVLLISLHLSAPYLAVLLFPLRPASGEYEVAIKSVDRCVHIVVSQRAVSLATLLQDCAEAAAEWARTNPFKGFKDVLTSG